MRWTSNDFGTIISRIDILRAVVPGQRCATVPYVRPVATSCCGLSGWPKVERVLQLIDAVEALGIDPADAAHDYWHTSTTACPSTKCRGHTRAPPSGLASSAKDRAMTGRATILLTALLAATAVLSSIARNRAPVSWNASESVPIGLYLLQPTDRLFVTELVAIEPPEPFATFLADGRFCRAAFPC